eukprot:26723-Pleurochrysis_carterae.AAC.4
MMRHAASASRALITACLHISLLRPRPSAPSPQELVRPARRRNQLRSARHCRNGRTKGGGHSGELHACMYACRSCSRGWRSPALSCLLRASDLGSWSGKRQTGRRQFTTQVAVDLIAWIVEPRQTKRFKYHQVVGIHACSSRSVHFPSHC